MSEAKVQRMIADACLGLGTDQEIERDVRSFLARHEIGDVDLTAIARSPARLSIYRRLVRNNLTGVTAKMMPRTRARVNALPRGGASSTRPLAPESAFAFDATFDAFLAEVAPRSHFLRDVPAEFLAWAVPRWRAREDIPRYAPDLAAHELVEFQIAAAPTPPTPPPLAEVAADRRLVFAEAKRLVRYEFAVHMLPPELEDRSEPPHRAVSLLVYRDAEHVVRYLELTPLAAGILEQLFAGQPLAEAISAACAAGGVSLGEAGLGDTAKLLADLGDRGVLLGGAP